jgi:hypothetical protein
MPQAKPCDSYIIDTYKQDGKYYPGAITYSGRKKLEAMQWKDKGFATQQEADAFVRDHFGALGIAEAENEGALRKAS